MSVADTRSVAGNRRKSFELPSKHIGINRLNEELDPWIIMFKVGPLVLYVERTVNEDRDSGGSRVSPKVGQGIIQPPSRLEEVKADQDQFDIGTLGCCGNPWSR